MADLKKMEDSLKEFIVEDQSSSHDKGNINYGRCNNIKLTMNRAKMPVPHVIVTVGISEGIFSLESGEKVLGGLGPEEKYVVKWFNRYGVKDSLKKMWQMDEKAKVIKIDELKNG